MKLRTNVNARALGMKNDHLVEMILIGIFAAFCYVAVRFLSFQFGEQMVHMGNTVCLIAALLLGGWQGGLAGAIGMGFFDLTSQWIASTPKTLVLKLLMGLITGIIFFYGRRRPDKNPRFWIGLAAFITLLACIGFIMGRSAGIFGYTGNVMNKLWFAIVFLLILDVSLTSVLLISLITNRFSKPVLWAILGATLGVAVNVAGEFSWALVENLLLGLPMDAAMTATLLKIPGTFINGSFSVFVAVSVYIPLNASLIKAKLLKS